MDAVAIPAAKPVVTRYVWRVTSLDGGAVEHADYRHLADAREALDLLERQGVPAVVTLERQRAHA